MDIALERIKQCIDSKSTELDLCYLELKELPANLPPNLLNLMCGHNFIKELPTNLPESLTYLYCGNNEIKKLPAKLPNSLYYFNCSNNQINELPKLPESLQQLNCSYNKIKKLPVKLPSLTYLNCSNNQITKLQNLPSSLEILLFENNYIDELDISMLNSLKELYFRNNSIKELPSKLPITLYLLKCEWNDPYMYISKKNADMFYLRETSNYNQKAIIIQSKWRNIKHKKMMMRKIMMNMIADDNNELSYSFKNNGDYNVIGVIIQFLFIKN